MARQMCLGRHSPAGLPRSHPAFYFASARVWRCGVRALGWGRWGLSAVQWRSQRALRGTAKPSCRSQRSGRLAQYPLPSRPLVPRSHPSASTVGACVRTQVRPARHERWHGSALLPMVMLPVHGLPSAPRSSSVCSSSRPTVPIDVPPGHCPNPTQPTHGRCRGRSLRRTQDPSTREVLGPVIGTCSRMPGFLAVLCS